MVEPLSVRSGDVDGLLAWPQTKCEWITTVSLSQEYLMP